MKMKWMLSILLLSGCATATTVYGPDGKAYTFIACDGSAIPMSYCYDKALEVCPHGYYLVDQKMHNGPITAAAVGGIASVQQFQYKNITVSCK